jgi:large subunit ribosomal protein L3
MITGLIGKKIGMTQIYEPDGTVVPVTILKAGPCVVVQRKTTAKDGYEAVQLGLVEERPPKRVNKPMRGHFERAGVPPTRILREVRLAPGGEDPQVGQTVLVDIFREGELVHVTGTTKGKGFAGFVKRHRFAGGPASHGSMFHRAPGSIGASSYPSRVWPGSRMTGHMGMRRQTVRNLRVVRVESEKHLLVVKGSVPGPNGGYVIIRKAQV